MKDETNIDEFEQFLRNQADKHRMYPDDQIWRNINQQLHGNQRWPALTFGAILTGAILTACLIFLHPAKDQFKLNTLLSPASRVLSPSPVGLNPAKKGIASIAIVKAPDDKSSIYTFNSPHTAIVPEADPSIVPAELTPAILPSLASAEQITGEIALNARKNSTPSIITKNPDATTLQLVPNAGLSQDNIPLPDLTEVEGSGENTTAPETIQPNASPITPQQDLMPATKNSIGATVKKQLAVQFYGSSNISYRRLSEPSLHDDHFPYNSAISSNPRSNVNDFVSQRAAFGFELGAALVYPVNDRLSFKAGLQFNLRQYNIEAYSSTQQSSLLILNTSAGTDSVRVISAIGNTGGYRPLSLQNRYFQLAVPIGLNWKLTNGRKVNFSFAGTVQPTWQLNTNMYMVTSDYKSYTQQPDMIRRLNLNGALEAMLSIKSGNILWQVGPQLRYQLKPTQLNDFSIHEHLVDYGIKLGIQKQLK